MFIVRIVVGGQNGPEKQSGIRENSQFIQAVPGTASGGGT
jgi:hypothetical protein